MNNLDPTDLPYYGRQHGDGPALVFLHYWGGSARTWDATIRCLPAHEVIAIEARGWGRSRALPGPYTLEQLAEDTLAVVDNARLSDFVIVGHSMGGKVAQIVASKRPQGLRGLVLVAPAPARPAEAITAEYQEALSHAYDSAESVADARDQILTGTALSDDAKAQVVEDSLASSDAARAAWPLRGIAQDVTAQTRLIQVPTLIIGGEHDGVEPVDVLRSHLLPYLSDARIEVVAGSGHLIPLEAPEELAGAIAGFVDRLRPVAPVR